MRRGYEKGDIWWLLGALTVLLLLGAAYGHFMYGDWTCGMPGVECRKVK